MPQNIVQTKINFNRLARMTLYSVRQLYDGAYPEWKCQGFRFEGCHSAGADSRRTDTSEEFYHCSQCNFDQCKACYKVYENIHHHKMELISLEEA